MDIAWLVSPPERMNDSKEGADGDAAVVRNAGR
jgi:hypothetical protein